jgi:hypothetical protein
MSAIATYGELGSRNPNSAKPPRAGASENMSNIASSRVIAMMRAMDTAAFREGGDRRSKKRCNDECRDIDRHKKANAQTQSFQFRDLHCCVLEVHEFT